MITARVWAAGEAVDETTTRVNATFEHMPESGWRYGYPFALGIMLTITLVGCRFSKTRDWL